MAAAEYEIMTTTACKPTVWVYVSGMYDLPYRLLSIMVALLYAVAIHSSWLITAAAPVEVAEKAPPKISSCCAGQCCCNVSYGQVCCCATPVAAVDFTFANGCPGIPSEHSPVMDRVPLPPHHAPSTLTQAAQGVNAWVTSGNHTLHSLSYSPPRPVPRLAA